jgi:hypothetical protein
MYNVSTAITLAIGVACMYVILFVLALLVAVVLIDSSYLAQTLGHPAGVGSYLNLDPAERRRSPRPRCRARSPGRGDGGGGRRVHEIAGGEQLPSRRAGRDRAQLVQS